MRHFISLDGLDYADLAIPGISIPISEGRVHLEVTNYVTTKSEPLSCKTLCIYVLQSSEVLQVTKRNATETLGFRLLLG